MKNKEVKVSNENCDNLSKATEEHKKNKNRNSYKKLVIATNKFIEERRKLTNASNFPKEEIERDGGKTIYLDKNDEDLLTEAQKLISEYQE